MSALHSNFLREAEKKSAREYLKAKVKKLEDNEEVVARETDENQREDEEDDDTIVTTRRTTVAVESTFLAVVFWII